MVLSLIDNCLHMEWTLEHVVEASGYWVQLEFTKVRERWKQRKLLDQMKLNINRISANSLFGLHSTFAPRSWPRRWPWVRQRDNSCSQLCSGSRDPPTAECMHTWNCLRLQSAYHIDWNESKISCRCLYIPLYPHCMPIIVSFMTLFLELLSNHPTVWKSYASHAQAVFTH